MTKTIAEEKHVSNVMNEMRINFFEHSPLHYMLFDGNLNVIDVNQSAVRHYNVKREQLIGKNLLELSPDAVEKELYATYKSVLETGEVAAMDNMVTDSRHGNQHNNIKVFKVGEGIGVVATNITALMQSMEEMELFTKKSAHDLRSPLSSIQGLITLASTAIGSPEDMSGYLDKIRQQVTRLDGILKQSIAVSLTKGAELSMQKVDMKELVAQVKESIAYMDGFDAIAFEEQFANQKDFISDPFIITGIIQNLIENTIKYRNKAIKSVLKIGVVDTEDGVRISFSDNGIGIPEAVQPGIFKMFYRAHAGYPGTGLGLYTTRCGVERLGGYISFVSKENMGTTFNVFLPTYRPEEK